MKKLLLAAAALAALSATNVGATTIAINNWSIGANLIGSVSSPVANHGAVYINQFHYTGHDVDTNAVFDELTNCVDLEHYTATGTYTLASISTRIPDLTKLNQMLTFVGNTTSLVAGATGQQKNVNAAAMQLGIWEILYEGGNTNYDVGSGDFRSSYAGYVSQSDFTSAQTLANTWLGNTTGGAWSPIANTKLGYLYSPTAQSQMFLQAVPEPGQWALLISGFGFAGFAARRRRRRADQFVIVTA